MRLPSIAALRELREECGLTAELEGSLGVADEFVYSQAEATHFAKRSRFYPRPGDRLGTDPGRPTTSWSG